MFSFFRSFAPVIVACDISRSSVKVLAYEYNSKTQILAYLAYQKIPLKTTGDKLDSFLKALDVIETVLEAIPEQTGKRVREVHLSLPNGNLLLEVRDFHFARPHPETLVTPEELAELSRKLESEAEEVLFPEGAPQQTYQLLPPELERFTLDGYTVLGDIEAKGKELTITALISAWPEQFAEALRLWTSKFPRLRIQSYPEAILLRDFVILCLGGHIGGIVIDIGAEDSTLMLFENGTVDDLWTMPFGANDITRAMAKEFQISFEDAEVLKRQWSRGELGDPSSQRVARAAALVVEFWKHEWGALLEARAEIKIIPAGIYLAGGGSFLPAVVTGLSDSEWFEGFSAGRAASVSFLLPRDKEKPLFQSWPAQETGTAVLFSLVSRMIQKERYRMN
ncbi:MAG: hypothetical protein HYT40_02645 [Candidatus Sungbacteria bacterium]|uniref:SHS2 domain-containing protein n=1 Tax=Candidatus Sungiibacteriota bacterium TaxID=2750080 RepID=A0A931SDD7_9BACT|nr:hypothetical protein [Candidatus Sungbacteria bacterium]